MQRAIPRLTLGLALTAAAFLLSGCAILSGDFERPGAWAEAPGGGAVGYNVRAEVATRHDLFHGRGVSGATPYGGIIAAHAATQMNKKLSTPSGGMSNGGGSTGGQGAGASVGGS